MTNAEIRDIFDERYPDVPISDYKPIDDMFMPKGQGITLWTDKGDVIVFFPKSIDSESLKPCPFCGSEDIYETYSQEYALGTKNPEIVCNSCKIIFSIEDDSPYMNCDEDYAYRKAKTVEVWNRRVKHGQGN